MVALKVKKIAFQLISTSAVLSKHVSRMSNNLEICLPTNDSNLKTESLTAKSKDGNKVLFRL